MYKFKQEAGEGESTRRQALPPMLFLPLAALAAGLVSGIAGTGGGMLLTLALRTAFPGDGRSAMAISTLCILAFSVLTTILYTIQGHFHPEDAFPVLLPALLGGVLGALLLGKLSPRLLDLMLALLLVLGGARLLF